MRLFTSRSAARVARGSALLSAEVPGWASELDLDLFTIASNRFCVLGQLYEDRLSSDTASIGVRALRLSQRDAFRFGFVTTNPFMTRSLDRAWLREVERVRSLGALTAPTGPVLTKTG